MLFIFPPSVRWRESSLLISGMGVRFQRNMHELNAFSQIIPNVDFFISMHILKEATTSSRIEGTKTNMEEALIKEEDINPEKRDDWAEVQNYIRAINTSIKELDKLPLSNRLIRNTHKILLSGVRGKHKLPGEFRKSQNWIGATLKDAIYIPPHFLDVNDLAMPSTHFLYKSPLSVQHLETRLSFILRDVFPSSISCFLIS